MEAPNRLSLFELREKFPPNLFSFFRGPSLETVLPPETIGVKKISFGLTFLNFL